MSKDYLKGKCGTGLRAVWIGEKTTTSFAVYVLVRNMSTDGYNYIHDTALTLVGTRINKLTNVTVGVRNITTDTSGNTIIADLENDPLVVTGNSTAWYGLRIRRFEFTGLEAGREYTLEPYTDAVSANDPTQGRLASFQFKTKTLSNDHFSGMHFSCDLRKWINSSNFMWDALGQKESWFDVAERCMELGTDTITSQDDMDYSEQSGDGYLWIDPITVTSDTTARAITDDLSGLTSRDAVLNVEEQCTTYATDYYLVYLFFRALLHFPTMVCAMQSQLESTDSGDHLGTLNNNTFSLGDPKLFDALVMDYGVQSADVTTGPYVADSDTTNWLQDPAGVVTPTDPYTRTGTALANLKTDLNSLGTMTLKHKQLMEFFFSRAVAQPESETYVRPQYSALTDYATELTLDAYIHASHYRKREHPLADMFFLNQLYTSDCAAFMREIITGKDVALNPVSNSWAAYPSLCANVNQTRTMGQTQEDWLLNSVAASTKPFIVIYSGDPMLTVQDGADGDPYGQWDSIGQKSTAELNRIIAGLEAAVDANSNVQAVLILTGDNHAPLMCSNNGNILQLMAASPTAILRQSEQTGVGFIGQYTNPDIEPTNAGLSIGVSRFVITENRITAYNIELSSELPLSSDVAYFDKGDTKWKFKNRSSHTYEKVESLRSGLSSLRIN